MRRLAACLGVFVLSTSYAAAEHPLEDQVSAEILYNLVRFSEWTDTDATPAKIKYDICVCKDDEKVDVITKLHEKSVSENPVNVHTLQNRDEIKNACRVLYLSSGNYSTLDLSQIATYGVMTVGDEASFLDAGGQAIIARDGSRMAFELNHEMMKTARIKPSSKILHLSKKDWEPVPAKPAKPHSHSHE